MRNSRRLYRKKHRDSLAGLAYLAVTLPLDLIAAVLFLVGTLAGMVLLLTPLGAWLLAFVLWAAGRLAGARRPIAMRMLGEDVRPPPDPLAESGVFAWRRAMLTDSASWRALGYVLIKLPLALPALFLAASGYLYGLVAMTYFPMQERGPSTWWLLVIGWLSGGLMLVIAPWVAHPVLAIERMLIRGLLGRSIVEQRLAFLQDTRARAVADADVRLRQIERDLHDGAQARLIGVGMHLSMADELVTGEAPPEKVKQAVDAAQGSLTEAVAELRDIIRGIHPPVLDRGLDAALNTVAAGSVVPVTLMVDLAERPPAAIESILYFCACELITNVGRHSGARNATVRLTRRRGMVRLQVRDNGRGGARPRAGGGLAGLEDRVRVVDGRLSITSPQGGPTTITVEVPVPAST